MAPLSDNCRHHERRSRSAQSHHRYAGLSVGNAEDPRVRTGVTVVLPPGEAPTPSASPPLGDARAVARAVSTRRKRWVRSGAIATGGWRRP